MPTRFPINRRGLIAGVTAFLTLSAARANEILIDVESLQPGEFVWHADRQPVGPLAILVSLDQQRVHVYRNGIRIAVSTCSTGKKGHETPTGVFVILQKDKHHKSSTYNGAPMPNMNRLTWDGIALHAGNLPGYPASHGCVRLPMAFSEKLYGMTHLGTPVIIAGSATDPVELTHPGPLLSGYAHQEMAQEIAGVEQKLHPADWVETQSNQFTTIVVSRADGKGIVLENDEQIDEGAVSVTGAEPLGQHVFVLQSADQTNGFVWSAISHHNLTNMAPQTDADILGRLAWDAAFARRVVKRMHSGMILIVTETPLSPQMRSSDDFVIMDTES